MTLKRYTPLRRRARLRRFNPERRAARRIVDFGALGEFVRTFGCAVEGCGRRSECAHVKSRGAGGHAWLVDQAGRYVGNLVPLCHGHHSLQHTIGLHDFERGHRFRLRLGIESTTTVLLSNLAALIGSLAIGAGIDPSTNARREVS